MNKTIMILIILFGLVAFLSSLAGLILLGDGLIGNDDNSAGDADRHFIEQMIPHHEDAIAMANIALKRAEHPEIKQLASDIKEDQSREISQMREFYRRNYGTEVPSGIMERGIMGDSADIKRLENATPFDKAFIEEMVPHHRMAVRMAQMLLRTSDNQEMRGLAESIIKTQSEEIDKMREFYRQWYGQSLIEHHM